MADDFEQRSSRRMDGIDQHARDDARTAAAAITRHEAVCEERERRQTELLAEMRKILGEMRDENKACQNENSAKFAQQQNVNSELFVKLSRADAWRDDQTLFRCSLALNGAFFSAILMMGLKLVGKF